MKFKVLAALVLISMTAGCSAPSLPSMPISSPSIPFPSIHLPFDPGSIPFLGDVLKRLPFFSEEMEKPVNKSINQSLNKINKQEWGEKSKKPEGNLGGEKKVGTEQTEEKVLISRVTINPIHAEYNRSTGKWSVIFQLEFITNVKEEQGRWQIFLFSNKLVEKRYIDTTDINFTGINTPVKGFRTNFAVTQVREDDKFRIRMEKEVRLLQPGGGTAASYKLEKNVDVNFTSDVGFLNSKVSCGRIDYFLNFTGLIPAKLTLEIKLPGKTFFKSFRVVGGMEYEMGYDTNLNRDIFEVKNGVAEIHLDLEKFIRVAATPEKGGQIILKSSKVLSSISFAKPNVSVKGDGKIQIENGNGSLPIYIDSIALVDENARIIPVGRLLCDRIEIEKSYHGRLLVVGGPNLFWSEYKERYLTEKPEYILFDGRI